MNSDNFFRTPEEELARLNKELAEIREVLRDAVARLGEIERHVRCSSAAGGVGENRETVVKGGGGECERAAVRGGVAA